MKKIFNLLYNLLLLAIIVFGGYLVIKCGFGNNVDVVVFVILINTFITTATSILIEREIRKWSNIKKELENDK